MQQFTVPQFIDVEDKIFGPITVRQFVIILAGSLMLFVIFKFFSLLYLLTVGVFILVNMILFAFFKVAGRPFHFFVLNFIQTLLKASLRVWKNIPSGEVKEEIISQKIETKRIRKRQYTSSRLAELSLIVDTQGKFRHEELKENINLGESLKNKMNEIL
ncbi:MAG: PrgI family protein [Patescibacteria group bacterium]|jgi:dolichyl-phosphate-mannose--protein O-mannosyl transferase|nr:PrgI family protein [Patescibacteria group bacterium]